MSIYSRLTTRTRWITPALFYHCHNLESDDLWSYGLQLRLDDVQKDLLIDRVQDTVLDIITRLIPLGLRLLGELTSILSYNI